MLAAIVVVVVILLLVGGGHGGRKYRRHRRMGLTVRESIPFGRRGRITFSERFGGGEDYD